MCVGSSDRPNLGAGTGLGKNRSGIAAPIQAGGVAQTGGGIGAHRDHVEVSSADDAFSAYKKKMAMAYRFRPNPLVHTHNTQLTHTRHDARHPVTGPDPHDLAPLMQNNPRAAYWEDTNMNKGSTQNIQ